MIPDNYILLFMILGIIEVITKPIEGICFKQSANNDVSDIFPFVRFAENYWMVTVNRRTFFVINMLTDYNCFFLHLLLMHATRYIFQLFIIY